MEYFYTGVFLLLLHYLHFRKLLEKSIHVLYLKYYYHIVLLCYKEK